MDNVFYRNLRKNYLEVDYGEGIYLYDTAGKKYIDACAGAAVANLGHAHPQVVQALATQAAKVAFSHLSRWTSRPIQELADLVASLAPGSLNKLYLVSGGSEATEAALKMARQYFLERDGKSGKYKIISRWKSYHGSTLGALSMTGDKRRNKFTPLLANFPHIAPAYCYRCPFDKTEDTCGVDCALDLERTIKMEGADSIAAFIAAAVAVVKTLVAEKLAENVRTVGEYLLTRLREKLLPFWFVGDVRGKGLLLGVEFVRDKQSKEPFPASLGLAEKITVLLANNHGIIVYPGSGNADGVNGDQFLLAPPLILTRDQADEIVDKLHAGFTEFARTIA